MWKGEVTESWSSKKLCYTPINRSSLRAAVLFCAITHFVLVKGNKLVTLPMCLKTHFFPVKISRGFTAKH